ncbi:MAG: hypothetical protein J6U26_03950, partial [Lachnospiraceae bacterium]|nr:hypothetical protein [Lachnospiraceae bacterium]
MPDGPDAPGPGETHHSNTGEPDPSRDVLIDPAPLTDAEQALFDAYIAQNRPYATEQDYLGRLRNGAVVYSVYPCEASEGYPQNESIGPALFYKEHINNSLFFIDGKGVRSLSGAYRSGLVSDDEILALRDAFYRDDPDLAELYHPVFAAEKIRELFLSDDLYLHLVPGHLPEHISDAPDEEENMAELPALPVSMSESWDGSRAASLATGDLASRGGRTIIPGDRIIVTSPAHEGYAVHAYFSFRKNALYRTLVLETPYGDNVLSGSSADALYVYLLEQYRILAEQAGITTDPGPDPVA